MNLPNMNRAYGKIEPTPKPTPKPTQTYLDQPNRPEIIAITLIIVDSIGSHSRSLLYIVSYMSEIKDKISKKNVFKLD